jgi:hypothetical protein
MAFVIMIVVALVAASIYFFVAMSSVPGAKEERFGTLEKLPENLGKWQVDQASDAAVSAHGQGLLREVRHFYHEPQGFGAQGRLVLQVRYRDAKTRKIVRIEPERSVRRRRLRA